ncbi:MAG: hypothetical protein AAF998_16570 [Bacteroidota bacterium]
MRFHILNGLLLNSWLLLYSAAVGQLNQNQRGTHAVTIGVESREDGRIMQVGYEWLLGKRFAPNPAIGVGISGNGITGGGFADGTTWKYAGTLRLKYYILLNKRHLLEGLYVFTHFGYFRRSLTIKPDDYTYYRNYRSEIGIGIGVQWVIKQKFVVGANAVIPWSTGTDWIGNPDGSTRQLYRRTGFLYIWSFNVGITF